jgi:hypothetical protein
MTGSSPLQTKMRACAFEPPHLLLATGEYALAKTARRW